MIVIIICSSYKLHFNTQTTILNSVFYIYVYIYRNQNNNCDFNFKIRALADKVACLTYFIFILKQNYSAGEIPILKFVLYL